MNKRVVVTGMGTVSPLGNDVNTTWGNLTAGVSGIGLITHFDTSEFKTKIAGEVKNFDGEKLFGRKEVFCRASNVTIFFRKTNSVKQF